MLQVEILQRKICSLIRRTTCKFNCSYIIKMFIAISNHAYTQRGSNLRKGDDRQYEDTQIVIQNSVVNGNDYCFLLYYSEGGCD